MTATGPAELLAVWEAGLARPAGDRSRLLHRAARPAAGEGELLALTAGEREADLYALRRALFGERMQIRVACAGCGEEMEFDLDAAPPGADTPVPEGPLRVTEGTWSVEFRLPTVADVLAAASAPDRETARERLLERCAVTAAHDGTPVPAAGLARLLPDTVRRRIARAAEEADPAAATTLDVRCPECSASTPAELDIASFLWTEVDHWARDLLLDVHLLATAYGWSEPEILALSPLRRRYYLELCADV
ncbi:T4 family baseplate hub assembly chaperone [Streptomyces yaizuensis]|uniref:Collagen-like protein n=1 Tax=Streptomyces yaizuensis TaxID=2989713 RepID=A0ABQ5NRY2_9ACTN|nr:hypothetical protein [Streptomyces sp. YSPA8]GLF93132.1 collagen-like protein [Streptomyces sp. YSPA8]